MITWLNLFEKYRVDLRVLEFYRTELDSLSEHSHRRATMEEAIDRIEQQLHAAERLLAHYGDGILSPREALHFADERLFLAYRYLYGLTMEATALEMGISRDTVYRIRRRIVRRGAVPDEVLRRFGVQDLSAAIGRGDGSHEDASTADGEGVPPSGGARNLTAPSLLPCPISLSADPDDHSNVLAACFAGAGHGVPAAVMARRG